MSTLDTNINDFRQPEHEINPLIVERWSPRAMSGEALSEEELLSLFEAAKWAPSSSNEQPWRFIYAYKGTQHWEKLYLLLVDFNREWAARAGALILVISRQTSRRSGKPQRTASFDTGAAWQNLALEASRRGLIAHGMGGFDYDKARIEYNIPEQYKVEAMIAVGRPGQAEGLSPALRAREFPSDRRPLSETISEGKFNFD